MNTTELKALAEKATPGEWKNVDGIVLVHWDTHPYATWLANFSVGGESMEKKLANSAFCAAANPAAILELIAAHEDAQGEIRALRATEQNLLERVKALEEVAAALLPFADDASAINGYGYYRPKNPHDFHPDAESCTEDEIAAHKAACEAWDAGIYKDNYGDGWVSPNVHILRAPWGIGSYTDEVPEIAAICNRARALLEQKP